jgi:glycerol-3-phosphate acyltransferase PlsY
VAATLALPPAAWLTGAPASVVGTAAGTAGLIVFRHRANIRRLLTGTERRMGVPV